MFCFLVSEQMKDCCTLHITVHVHVQTAIFKMKLKTLNGTCGAQICVSWFTWGVIYKCVIQEPILPHVQSEAAFNGHLTSCPRAQDSNEPGMQRPKDLKPWDQESLKHIFTRTRNPGTKFPTTGQRPKVQRTQRPKHYLETSFPKFPADTQKKALKDTKNQGS